MSCVCLNGSSCYYTDSNSTCLYLLMDPPQTPNEVECGPRFNRGPYSSFYVPIPPKDEGDKKK